MIDREKMLLEQITNLEEDKRDLQQENKHLKRCLDEIDIIFYRMRFVDFYSNKDWIKFTNECINDVREICQNPYRLDDIIKGDRNE